MNEDMILLDDSFSHYMYVLMTHIMEKIELYKIIVLTGNTTHTLFFLVRIAYFRFMQYMSHNI